MITIELWALLTYLLVAVFLSSLVTIIIMGNLIEKYKYRHMQRSLRNEMYATGQHNDALEKELAVERKTRKKQEAIIKEIRIIVGG